MSSFRRTEAKKIAEQFPRTSLTKLGQLLYKRHPKLYTNENDAKWCVREVTGRIKGSTARISKEHLTDKWVGLQIPEGDLNDYKPFNLTAKRVGLLYDIHIPFHDLKALNLAVKDLLKAKPDCIILGGDLMDCYQLSTFEKDPRERSFKYEIDTTKAFLSELRKKFKGRIIFLEGNHDYRLERFFRMRAPELLGIEAITMPELLELRRFDVEFVNNKRVIRLGKLNIVHGHEFGNQIFSPVNPARGLYLKAKRNVIAGHHHQTSTHTENDIEGNVTGAWSVGCLCDLHPRYTPINKWNQGFALVEVEKGGNFVVHNRKIVEGKIA